MHCFNELSIPTEGGAKELQKPHIIACASGGEGARRAVEADSVSGRLEGRSNVVVRDSPCLFGLTSASQHVWRKFIPPVSGRPQRGGSSRLLPALPHASFGRGGRSAEREHTRTRLPVLSAVCRPRLFCSAGLESSSLFVECVLLRALGTARLLISFSDLPAWFTWSTKSERWLRCLSIVFSRMDEGKIVLIGNESDVLHCGYSHAISDAGKR